MSNNHYCQVHIVNNLSQQLAAVFAARETITAYSRTVCHLFVMIPGKYISKLLVLHSTIRDQYQDLALKKLLHDITVT